MDVQLNRLVLLDKYRRYHAFAFIQIGENKFTVVIYSETLKISTLFVPHLYKNYFFDRSKISIQAERFAENQVHSYFISPL